MNITTNELLENGYTVHQSEWYKTYRSTDTLYQKAIKDSTRMLYFINL